MTTFPNGAALLVTGANGRVGRLLRAALAGAPVGGLPVLWQARQAGAGIDLAWDILKAPPPRLGAGSVILHLAGRVAGPAEVLAENLPLTRAAASLARDSGAHLFLMSTAAVYAPGPRDLAEDDPPAPPGPYGAFKLQAEAAATGLLPPGQLTILRLANLAGGDVLFGNIRAGGPISLDPVPGQPGGPLRSYIGPQSLVRALDGLVAHRRAGHALPPILNLAQPGVLAMADLLQAAGVPWSWGPPRAAVVPRVTLDTSLLQALVPLPPATPASLLAEVAACQPAPP